MTEVWVTIGVLIVTTAATRAAGPVLLGGRELPAAFRGVVALVAPSLLAALVVVQTVGAPEGGAFEFDARVIGVGAAAVALGRGAHMLTVVAIATVVTALARLVS
jgi:branched-subunit amino acid transport protein